MTTEAKIPFSLLGCQTCACNFSATMALSEDLETGRALCNQKFFFLIHCCNILWKNKLEATLQMASL